MTINLRARFDMLARLPLVNQIFQFCRRQIFIGVLEHLDHWRVDAGSQAFHFFPTHRTISI